MITSITEAMQKIVAVEQDIEAVVDDVNYKIEAAFPFPPSGLNGDLPTPCFINYVKLDSMTGANSARTRFYTVRAHLYLAKRGSDLAQWGLVAADFHQQILDAFGKAVMLGETNAIIMPTSDEGGSEIPAVLSWNSSEPTHYGLEFILNLQITDSFDWGP